MRKPHGGRLRVALAFPNTYFVGMSNLGFQTVYSLFNAEDGIVCPAEWPGWIQSHGLVLRWPARPAVHLDPCAAW